MGAFSAFDTLTPSYIVSLPYTYLFMYASISQLYQISSDTYDLEQQNIFLTAMKSWKMLSGYLPLNQNPLSEEHEDEKKELERQAWALRPGIFSKINILVLVLALSNIGLLSLLLYEMKTTQSPPGYGIFFITTAAGVHG